MKKRITFLSLLVASMVGSGGFAQDAAHSKMSPYTRILLDRMEKNDTPHSSLRSTTDGEYLSAFVTVETEEAWAEVEALGCRIQTRTGNIATVLIPLSQVEALSKLANVQYISASQPMTLNMDSARYYSKVTDVHAGKDLPHPYTGKDVIVGVVDVGFDYTHPNFYDKTGKTYRLKQVWEQNSSIDKTIYTTESEILEQKYSLDSDTETHGTHVMGMAAGGGYDTPYQGVAYESDMMAVATTMRDADIVNGVDYLFQESEKAGKPCVVNLSLGSTIDAHDGTAMMDLMLDRLTGPGKIITAGMGNSGSSQEYVALMSPGDTLRTFVERDPKKTNLKKEERCIVSLWGDKPKEDFSITLGFYDPNKKSFIGNTEFLSADTLVVKDGYYCYYTSPEGVKYEAQANAALYPYNDKYNIQILFVYPEEAPKIHLALQVTSKNTPVRAWASKCSFQDNGMSPVATAGSGDFSIGSPASAHNVISVGAYTTRFGNVDTHEDNFVSELGKLAPFSSVGPTLDNRIKPEITAPGQFVISSYNSYYLEREGEDYEKDRKRQVKYSSFNGREYPWGYMRGTSMACPFVTGTIALWLQANPTLTPDDIKEVFSRTAIQDQEDESYPNNRWGWGKIDAYKGLLEVLNLPTSTENIFEEKPYEAVSVYAGTTPGSFHVRWAEVPGAFSIQVFDASGRNWYANKVEAPTSVDYPVVLGTTQPGIYFIRIETAEGVVERKIKL